MRIDILEFVKNTDPMREKTLGWIHLCLGEKIEVWMVVSLGKNKAFVKFPSLKPGNNDWQPSIKWLDGEVEKKIANIVLEEIDRKGYLS